MSRPTLKPTQPPIQWEMGILSLGVKQPGHKVNHTPPSSAKVKLECSHTSTPPVWLHGIDYDSFTFYQDGGVLHHICLAYFQRKSKTKYYLTQMLFHPQITPE
jgi:hypothetical protein